MSKPWDNEPTTKTDGVELVAFSISMLPYNTVSSDFSRNLERRLRHAERLLERFRRGETSISAIETLHNDNIFHLEAARQEDGR